MTHDDVRQVGYDDADAQLLVDLVQQEYVRRYGGPDDSPLDPAEFRPPDGQFVPMRRTVVIGISMNLLASRG